MKFTSIQSPRETIFEALQQCRQKTLTLFEGIDSYAFCQQAHPDFSPVGWHLELAARYSMPSTISLALW